MTEARAISDGGAEVQEGTKQSEVQGNGLRAANATERGI